MKRAPVADAEARLSAYLEECQREGPIVLTENGRAIAVLLAPQDEEDLERLVLSHSPRFEPMLEQSRQSITGAVGGNREDARPILKFAAAPRGPGTLLPALA